MVSPEYVRYLVEVANEKMEANRKRTERFFGLLQSSSFVGLITVDNGNHVSMNESFNLTGDSVDDAPSEKKNGQTSSGILCFNCG